MKVLFISIILLYLSPFGATAQQTKTDDAEFERLAKTPQGKVVVQYNEREVAWLKDPNNAEREKEFYETVERGSAADRDVLDLVGTNRIRGTHLMPETTHFTKVISVVVNGNNATVKTLEEPNWISSSGRKYQRQKWPHTYTLKKAGDKWVVVLDDFEL